MVATLLPTPTKAELVVKAFLSVDVTSFGKSVTISLVVLDMLLVLSTKLLWVSMVTDRSSIVELYRLDILPIESAVTFQDSFIISVVKVTSVLVILASALVLIPADALEISAVVLNISVVLLTKPAVEFRISAFVLKISVVVFNSSVVVLNIPFVVLGISVVVFEIPGVVLNISVAVLVWSNEFEVVLGVAVLVVIPAIL